MPVYAYRCLDCGETFEQIEHMADHDAHKEPHCPKCDGQNVVQVFAPFYPKTVKKG